MPSDCSTGIFSVPAIQLLQRQLDRQGISLETRGLSQVDIGYAVICCRCSTDEPQVISSIHIRGFRSLADFSLEEIPKAAVLIGANDSGKSKVLKFFEMLSWMVMTRQLGIFVGDNGAVLDDLFGKMVLLQDWKHP